MSEEGRRGGGEEGRRGGGGWGEGGGKVIPGYHLSCFCPRAPGCMLSLCIHWRFRPVHIFGENINANGIANNTSNSSRTRHIALRERFVSEKALEGMIKV